MKLLMIANTIYLPIMGTNKYISGSISGLLFIDQIFTLEEIQDKHGKSSCPIEECKDLHDMCKQWGTK